jgi:hypothetical protein
VQHTQASDWYDHEVAQLEDEVALLTRLIAAIRPLGKTDANSQRPGMETSTRQSPTRSKKNQNALRDTHTISPKKLVKVFYA